MTKIKLTTIKITQKKYLCILSKNQDIQLEFHHAKFSKVILNFTLNSRQLPTTGQTENTCTMIRRSPSLLTLALILVKERKIMTFFFSPQLTVGEISPVIKGPFLFLKKLYLCDAILSVMHIFLPGKVVTHNILQRQTLNLQLSK